MARVNVFLKDELLKAVDHEAAESRTNRSALLQAALRDFLETRRVAREEGERRRAMEAACQKIDRVAERLGKWDGVRIVRKARETRRRTSGASK